MLWPKGQPIYFDKLMLGCEEKDLVRVLRKFFFNWVNLSVAVFHKGMQMLHVAAYAAVHSSINIYTYGNT